MNTPSIPSKPRLAQSVYRLALQKEAKKKEEQKWGLVGGVGQ